MRKLKLTVLIAFIAFASVKAQETRLYGNLQYWGRDIPITSSFFEILNSKYSMFINNIAPNRRYFDYDDYSTIYVNMVENIKRPTFTVIVTEANMLQSQNQLSNWPNSNDTNKNKKNRARSAWIFYEVLLPSLQQFAQHK